jgi:alpha-1,4-digalacturonate transport system substrate-binding protein
VNSSQESDEMKSLFGEYTKLHPEVTFNLQVVPYDNYNDKLAQLVAGGTPPDLAKTTGLRPEIQPFLVNLAQYYGKDWINHFVKSFAIGAQFGSKVLAAPLDLTATGMMLNKSAFDKAGVKIPAEEKGWTWPEFLAAIKQVSDQAQVRYPLVWDVTAGRWITYPYGFGQHVFSENPPYQVTLTTEGTAQLLKSFLAMADTYMPKGLWTGSSSDNPKQIFLGGQAVAWMSGSWNVQSLVTDAKVAWQAGPTPYGTTRSSVVGGDYVIGFRTAHHVQQSTDFIRWLTDAKAQAEYGKGTMYIPANVDAGKVDYGNAMASQAMNALQYELKISPPYAGTDSGNPAMQYVWDTIKQSVTQAASGTATPDQAAAAIVAAAKNGLAKTASQ